MLVFVLVLAVLFSQKLVLANSVTYEVDFVKSNQFVRGPYPEGRVEQSESSVLVKYEPVYFSIYSPRHFKQAKVTIRYKKTADLKSQLGLKLNLNKWAFFFEDLPETGDQFIEYELIFDLANAEYFKNNIKFIIAAPGIDSHKGVIEIDRIKFDLLK